VCMHEEPRAMLHGVRFAQICSMYWLLALLSCVMLGWAGHGKPPATTHVVRGIRVRCCTACGVVAKLAVRMHRSSSCLVLSYMIRTCMLVSCVQRPSLGS
jgi:hypothetical protein